MTIKSMKISRTALITAINEMEDCSITKEEKQKSISMRTKATSGELGRECKFFEQMASVGEGTDRRRSSKSPIGTTPRS